MNVLLSSVDNNWNEIPWTIHKYTPNYYMLNVKVTILTM